MYIYSEDKKFAIGCVQGSCVIMFNRPVPAWAVVDND